MSTGTAVRGTTPSPSSGTAGGPGAPAGPATTGGAVLRRTVRRNARRLTGGSALIGVHQSCEVSVPVLIGVIVDRAVDGGRVGAIIVWIGVLAALFLVLTTAYRLGARLLMVAIASEAHLLRVELSHRILDPRGLRTDYRAGELLSISSTDADETSYLLDYVPRVTGAVVATLACGAVSLFIDLRLGAMVLLGMPVVVAALQVTAPMIARRVEDQQAEIGRATALATDLIRGHRPLRGIGATRHAADRYQIASRRSLAATLRAARISGVHAGAAAAAGALAGMAIAVTAAYLAMHGALSLGELITMIGLVQFLVEPFSLLAIVPSWVAEARASANRVATVLGAPVDHDEHPPAPQTTPGTVSVRGPAGAAGVAGLVLEVRAGEFVAVLAADDRDATALTDLLGGRVRPQPPDGVLVGGRALSSIPRGERRAAIIVEPHDGDLFTGTLAENLWVGRPGDHGHHAAGPGGPAIAAVLAASSATDVVDAHPDGLAQRVTERGASLSGGQRQRWTLARALLADPEVLVLHDPTTAVDAVTEQAIADGLRRLRSAARRTTVVVTSSPALLAAADRVLLVVDGAVRVEGRHDELVGRSAEYRSLVTR